MPKQTLLDLSADVTRLLAAGAEQAPADDGLRRRAQRLRELGKQVPALLPIADAVDKALAAKPRDAAAALLDLAVVVRQVRAGLTASGAVGTLEPLPDGSWATPTAQRNVATLLELLDGAGSAGRMDQLKDAIQRQALGDMRLIQPLVKALADGHAPFAELVATQALPAFGPSVLPYIETGLNLQGKALDARRILAVCAIDKNRGKELCLKALDDGSAPLKVQALECLGGLDPTTAEQAAMKFLADPKSEMRAAAVVALTGVAKDEVLNAIIGLLDDTKEVWASATKSLAKFAHPDTTGRLVRELEKASADWEAVPPDAKKPAAKAAKPAKATAKSKGSAQEKECKRLQERLERLAAVTTVRPDRATAADALIALSGHSVADLRVAALQALGKIGVDAPEQNCAGAVGGTQRQERGRARSGGSGAGHCRSKVRRCCHCSA